MRTPVFLLCILSCKASRLVYAKTSRVNPCLILRFTSYYRKVTLKRMARVAGFEPA